MEQNNKTTKSLEEALNQAFRLWEKGNSSQKILDLFPEYQKEISELFHTVEIIKENKSGINPSKELLTKILSQMNASVVTKTVKNRSIHQEESNNAKEKFLTNGAKGQFSIFELFNFMAQKTYFLAGAVAIVIVLIAGIYYFKDRELVILSENQELAYLAEDLTKDIDDLNEIAQEGDLAIINQDLLDLSEEDAFNEVSKPEESSPDSHTVIDISSISSLENELDVEIKDLLGDLADLEGFDSDTSLNSLDAELSSFSE